VSRWARFLFRRECVIRVCIYAGDKNDENEISDFGVHPNFRGRNITSRTIAIDAVPNSL